MDKIYTLRYSQGKLLCKWNLFSNIKGKKNSLEGQKNTNWGVLVIVESDAGERAHNNSLHTSPYFDYVLHYKIIFFQNIILFFTDELHLKIQSTWIRSEQPICSGGRPNARSKRAGNFMTVDVPNCLTPQLRENPFGVYPVTRARVMILRVFMPESTEVIGHSLSGFLMASSM